MIISLHYQQGEQKIIPFMNIQLPTKTMIALNLQRT